MPATAAAIDYDPFRPDFYTSDPFALYRRMRDEAPVWHSERFGWYALTRFDDVRSVLLDPDLYRFTRSLESLGKIMNPSTSLILRTDAEPFNLFQSQTGK